MPICYYRYESGVILVDKTTETSVKYKNELNLIPLKNFNAKQMDLFFALCARMKDKGLQKIRFSFEDLKDLSDYKMTAIDAFISDLEKLYKNMINLTYRTEDSRAIEYFVLFTGFKIDKSEHYVEISVNPDLEYVINGLTAEFSSFQLSALTNLRSTYSKTLFRLLMQFKSTGYYIVKVEDFRDLLNIPKSYRMSNIDQTVLKPSLSELSNYFNDLEVVKIKAKKGNKVAKLQFTFSGIKTETKSKIPMHNWLEGE